MRKSLIIRNALSLALCGSILFGGSLPALAQTSYTGTSRTVVLTEMPFTDVPGSAWYRESVQYVYDIHAMSGTDETTFAPAKTLSRAQFVTILYRLAGSPAVSGASPFADIPSGSAYFYAKPAVWAAKEGIVSSGPSNPNFNGGAFITREQLAVMLWRASGESRTADGDLSVFKDAKDVSAFAKDAMAWAVGKGIITGKTSDTLCPKSSASRAEAAAMIMRYDEAMNIVRGNHKHTIGWNADHTAKVDSCSCGVKKEWTVYSTLNVKRLWQNLGPYASNKITGIAGGGNSNNTIAKMGCQITSYTMTYNYIHGTSLTPKQFMDTKLDLIDTPNVRYINTVFTDDPAYCIDPALAKQSINKYTKVWSPNSATKEAAKFKFHKWDDNAVTAINGALNKGIPVVVYGIRSDKDRYMPHFIVCYSGGKTIDDMKVIDPYSVNGQPWADYKVEDGNYALSTTIGNFAHTANSKGGVYNYKLMGYLIYQK